MASNQSTSIPPAGVPSSNGKYIGIAVGLVALVVALIGWKTCQKPPPPQVVTQVVDAAAPLPPKTNDDDIPPPPPVEEDAGEVDAGKKVAGPVNNQCDAKKCAGTDSPELTNALSFRVKQAHRCYDNALAQDSTLRGKMTVAVRVGSNGQVCSANIASNDMGSAAVGSCVVNYFRSASFPAPKGGCADINIPINFVPRQ